jgi:hypothetical protein
MLEDLFHFGHPRPAFFVPCSLTDLVTRGFAINRVTRTSSAKLDSFFAMP